MEITVEIDELRSIYSELLGYYDEAPKPKEYVNQNGKTTESHFWDNLNSTLKKLNLLTENEYSDFYLKPKLLESRRSNYIDLSHYRTTLSRLIRKIHSDFYNNEPLPFNNKEAGQIVFNQNISQQQIVSINIFEQQLEEKIKEYKEGSPERSFLERLKDYVATADNLADILYKSFNLAEKLKIQPEVIANIFS